MTPNRNKYGIYIAILGLTMLLTLVLTGLRVAGM